MSIKKLHREKKRQMGQFLTPPQLARQIVEKIPLTKEDRVLEPSMGDGSFILPLIERFIELYEGTINQRLDEILKNNIWGVELDPVLYEQCLENIKKHWNYLPKQHNFVQKDFFRTPIQPRTFNLVLGNPPFGGSLDSSIEDHLDSMYGFRQGLKIKKETYAFFIIKSIDLLDTNGRLLFICSDTFLTINTMKGLRAYLMNSGDIQISKLDFFSPETNHPIVLLDYRYTNGPGKVKINGTSLERDSILKTGNLSFGLTNEYAKYFTGPKMGDFFVATSGMTTGKNEYFVREIQEDGCIQEPYTFSFHDEKITLANELSKARLGKLSVRQQEKIKNLENSNATQRVLKIERKNEPTRISLPDKDYRYYNKANNAIIYSPPTHVIYWANDGEAVLTYKKNGNWYLRGVGGQRHFFREGITWQLIASRLHMSYLPNKYVLDSGAPCAFPRNETSQDEIFFALAWGLTDLATKILKNVINHTKNIQGKDFERLPYPFWVSGEKKKEAIALMRARVVDTMNGRIFRYGDTELEFLESMFIFPNHHEFTRVLQPKEFTNMALF